jgi:predicted component of type VI protein secretion system
VTDLGSANSTFLNGQRLMPHEPRVLRDNDEVRLGRLVFRVNFV